MPVRIYEIAKDLNLDTRTVLIKAKKLGIPAAKVASSSLDRITAEYLREQLLPLSQVLDPIPLLVDDLNLNSSEVALLVSLLAYVDSTASLLVHQPTKERLSMALSSRALKKGDDVIAKVREVTYAFEPDSLWKAWYLSSQSEFFHQLPLRNEDKSPDSIQLPIVTQKYSETTYNEASGTRQPLVVPRPPENDTSTTVIKLPIIDRKHTPVAQKKSAETTPTTAGPSKQPPFVQRPTENLTPTIVMKLPIVIRKLAEQMGKHPVHIIADLVDLGVSVTVDQSIDKNVARMLCAKNNIRLVIE